MIVSAPSGTGAPVANRVGVLGAWFSDGLLFAFGASAWWLITFWARICRIGSITPDAWMRQAVGTPLSAEPLLAATARALDLSALHSDAPRTTLDLDATVRTQGTDQPAQVQMALANRDAGRWNEGRLPLRALFAEPQAPESWLARWKARCGQEGNDGAAQFFAMWVLGADKP